MRFGNYNKEKPEKNNSSVYLKAMLFGILGSFLLILVGLTIKFIIKLFIQYWIWVLVVAAGLFLLKKFFFKSKKKKIQQLPEENYYGE